MQFSSINSATSKLDFTHSFIFIFLLLLDKCALSDSLLEYNVDIDGNTLEVAPGQTKAILSCKNRDFWLVPSNFPSDQAPGIDTNQNESRLTIHFEATNQLAYRGFYQCCKNSPWNELGSLPLPGKYWSITPPEPSCCPCCPWYLAGKCTYRFRGQSSKLMRVDTKDKNCLGTYLQTLGTRIPETHFVEYVYQDAALIPCPMTDASHELSIKYRSGNIITDSTWYPPTRQPSLYDYRFGLCLHKATLPLGYNFTCVYKDQSSSSRDNPNINVSVSLLRPGCSPQMEPHVSLRIASGPDSSKSSDELEHMLAGEHRLSDRNSLFRVAANVSLRCVGSYSDTFIIDDPPRLLCFKWTSSDVKAKKISSRLMCHNSKTIRLNGQNYLYAESTRSVFFSSNAKEFKLTCEVYAATNAFIHANASLKLEYLGIPRQEHLKWYPRSQALMTVQQRQLTDGATRLVLSNFTTNHHHRQQSRQHSQQETTDTNDSDLICDPAYQTTHIFVETNSSQVVQIYFWQAHGDDNQGIPMCQLEEINASFSATAFRSSVKVKHPRSRLRALLRRDRDMWQCNVTRDPWAERLDNFEQGSLVFGQGEHLVFLTIIVLPKPEVGVTIVQGGVDEISNQSQWTCIEDAEFAAVRPNIGLSVGLAPNTIDWTFSSTMPVVHKTWRMSNSSQLLMSQLPDDVSHYINPSVYALSKYYSLASENSYQHSNHTKQPLTYCMQCKKSLLGTIMSEGVKTCYLMIEYLQLAPVDEMNETDKSYIVSRVKETYDSQNPIKLFIRPSPYISHVDKQVVIHRHVSPANREVSQLLNIHDQGPFISVVCQLRIALLPENMSLWPEVYIINDKFDTKLQPVYTLTPYSLLVSIEQIALLADVEIGCRIPTSNWTDSLTVAFIDDLLLSSSYHHQRLLLWPPILVSFTVFAFIFVVLFYIYYRRQGYKLPKLLTRIPNVLYTRTSLFQSSSSEASAKTAQYQPAYRASYTIPSDIPSQLSHQLLEAVGSQRELCNWHVTWSSVYLTNIILGQGEFASVRKAQLLHLPRKLSKQIVPPLDVAVKQPSGNPVSSRCLLNELSIMVRLAEDDDGHPNIVGLMGMFVGRRPTGMSLLIEYCSLRSLKSFIEQQNNNCFSPRESADLYSLTIGELCRIAREITAGVEYIKEHGIIHRDLATRNVLLNEKLVAKVSDFGLAVFVGRDGEDEIDEQLERSSCRPSSSCTTSTIVSEQSSNDEKCYRIVTLEKKLPFRILPLEALRYQTFFPASDVWELGLLFCQLFWLERHQPFERFESADRLRDYLLTTGQKQTIPDLKQPKLVNDQFWRLIQRMLAIEHQSRPPIKEIKQRLDVIFANQDHVDSYDAISDFLNDNQSSLSNNNNNNNVPELKQVNYITCEASGEY